MVAVATSQIKSLAVAGKLPFLSLNGQAIKRAGSVTVIVGCAWKVLPLGRSVQSTWRKRLGAPTSPAHPKEPPRKMAAVSVGSVFNVSIVVVVSLAKIRRGAGVLAVGDRLTYCD